MSSVTDGQKATHMSPPPCNMHTHALDLNIWLMALINVILPGDGEFSNDHNPASFGPHNQIWIHNWYGYFHGEDQPLVQVQQHLPGICMGRDATHRLGLGTCFSGSCAKCLGRVLYPSILKVQHSSLFHKGNTRGSGITRERQDIELIH